MTADFKPGNRWDMINSLRARASVGSCGKHHDTHDPRPYGIALIDQYPGLLDGNSTDALRLLTDGIDRGSAPMCVAALLVIDAPIVWLDAAQRQRLHRLIVLAQFHPDLAHVFEEEIDF